MLKALEKYQPVDTDQIKVWYKAAPLEKFPKNGGACIKYKEKQIAEDENITLEQAKTRYVEKYRDRP